MSDSSDDRAAAAGPGQVSAAVLFADISGSTTLYETLGDTLAKTLIDECLAAMRRATARHGGRVIKTIGDELMCVFPDADRGSLAASEMQLSVCALPEVSSVKRAIRVGFHAGPVLEAEGDVFGDTVNTAARMAGLAKGNQIITTSTAVAMMSPLLRGTTRRIAAVSVKGKSENVEVCEVIWQGGDDLTMATTSIVQSSAPASCLQLRHGARQLELEGSGARAVLGRDASCHVVLADRKASRVHARIERRRDNFFLIDQSTNGTYVGFVGESEIALRREEVMLRGAGRITFGHGIAESDKETVDFTVLRGAAAAAE